MCGWAIGFGGFLKSISHVPVLGPCKEALYMRRLSYFWGSGEIMYACDLKGGSSSWQGRISAFIQLLS